MGFLSSRLLGVPVESNLMFFRLSLGCVPLALSGVLLSASCGAASPMAAERCVLIDLQQLRGREILPLLKVFADDHGLDIDLSHPMSFKYARDNEKRRPTVLVVYTTGLGEFGAALSLFRFVDEGHDELVADFDKFVKQELAPRYDVIQCAERPGFQMPSIYR